MNTNAAKNEENIGVSDSNAGLGVFNPQSNGAAWLLQAMQRINELTPNIAGKAFDPDWFLLREHLQLAATLIDQAEMERLPIAYRWWNERNQCWDYDNDPSDGAQPLYEAP